MKINIWHLATGGTFLSLRYKFISEQQQQHILKERKKSVFIHYEILLLDDDVVDGFGVIIGY